MCIWMGVGWQGDYETWVPVLLVFMALPRSLSSSSPCSGPTEGCSGPWEGRPVPVTPILHPDPSQPGSTSVVKILSNLKIVLFNVKVIHEI